MQRMTQKVEGQRLYIIENQYISTVDGGFTGEAVIRLAKFENLWEELLSLQAGISTELEKLHCEGKIHTVRFRELMIKKLTNSNILDLFLIHGMM